MTKEALTPNNTTYKSIYRDRYHDTILCIVERDSERSLIGNQGSKLPERTFLYETESEGVGKCLEK